MLPWGEVGALLIATNAITFVFTRSAAESWGYKMGFVDGRLHGATIDKFLPLQEDEDDE